MRPEYDLRCGDYRDTLGDETWDLLCMDSPYSAKTHKGHNDGTSGANRVKDWAGRVAAKKARGETLTYNEKAAAIKLAIAERKGADRRLLTYPHWTPDDVRTCVEWAHPRTRGWMVCFCDHVLAPVWGAAMEAAGRYTFAPLVWYAPGSRVRMTGDGPACWVTWIVVSRPKRAPFSKWGSLPGGYSFTGNGGTRAADAFVSGAKPLDLMDAVVCDYSRPGDVVCDLTAGGGTTLLAAIRNGRYAIGSERDPETHAKALARLKAARSLPLFDSATLDLFTNA